MQHGSGALEKCVYEKSKKVEYFDYSNLVFPLILRKWKSGDRIQPLGMKGNKKVSDILIDHGMELPIELTPII